MSLYCISVKTGLEEKFKENVLPLVNGNNCAFQGFIHILRKRMRLKNGKEYFDAFFPGYVFLETEECEASKLYVLSGEKYFLRFLPSNSSVSPLVKGDLEIVSSILRFGSTVGIVPVKFDAGDRVIITDGPFKDFSGNVIAVNRRNKRLNIQIDFMNGMRVVGLCYEEVQKQPAK